MSSVCRNSTSIRSILLLLAVCSTTPSDAWSFKAAAFTSHPKVLHQPTSSTVTMDAETTAPSVVLPVPTFLQDKWRKYRSQQQQQQRQHKLAQAVSTPVTSSVSTTVGQLPWLKQNSADNDSDDVDTVFLSHWNWQLQFLEETLNNLRVNDDQEDITDLMYVESEPKSSSTSSSSNDDTASKQQQRIYTVSLQSDEYRDIRMTYLQCDGAAQIFRCTCYPRNDMPVLGMGLMQLGAQRHVNIIDFQPLLQDDGNAVALKEQSKYTERLQDIRASYESMQQPMTNRHFDPAEQKYFTATPIIGKWAKEDADAASNWQDLQNVHQECVAAHVQLTQDYCQQRMEEERSRNNNNKDDEILQLHSDYDTFVASKEPASQLLSSAFGKDIAQQLVHKVLFSLSTAPAQSS